jgi:hypothetical protein
MNQPYPSSGSGSPFNGPPQSAPWTVPPDPGCYEERYKLMGVAVSLAGGLLAVGLGALWHTPQLIFAAFTVLLAIPAVLAMALHPVAFRADQAGVTLGAVRVLPPRPAVFIPWADIEEIILYVAGSGRKGVECVGVQRRAGAPALPYGNEWAPGCPVSGVAAGAARRMTHWRLDRERLAAVTAAAAPGISIIEAQRATPSGALGDPIYPLGRPPRPM